MSDFSQFKHLYDTTGPFVTVYLDATRATESGEHEIELRWWAIREELEAHGVDAAELEAIGAAITDDREPGRHGLVLVAAGGSVVFQGRLDTPPAQSASSFGPLPHLLPYLSARVQDVPHVLVLADRTGADLGYSAGSGTPRTTTSVDSDRQPVHRTGRDVWGERHFQNRVENTWDANAHDVAEAVQALVRRSGAELVVVAGDERAVRLIRETLGTNGPHVVEVSGGRGDGGSPELLEAGIRDAVLRHVWSERRALLEHVQQNLGRERFAVAGISGVLEALRKGQVDTVVLSDDPSSTLQAWIGPNPLDLALQREDLTATGVDDPVQVRLDAALLRAVVGSGARIVLTPNAHDYVPDGIAALLRYEG